MKKVQLDLIKEAKLQLLCINTFIEYVSNNNYIGNLIHDIDEKDETLLGYAYELDDMLTDIDNIIDQTTVMITIDLLIKAHESLDKLKIAQ